MHVVSQARGISAVIGLLNGAYDTTHATTTWFLYHVAKFPAVQARLLQEIDSISESHTPELEYSE